jgi:hypothetical protein
MQRLLHRSLKGESMKRFFAAIALACVLSVSAFAGEIPSGGFAAPPPPPDTTETTSTILTTIVAVISLLPV